mmetsp:Transcript_16970/g.37069  ORF Transcript_16970/g.37069 Transcript_16970/m.37069 type:complete len:267 (-) Transcript_16970:2809-3609(-)
MRRELPPLFALFTLNPFNIFGRSILSWIAIGGGRTCLFPDITTRSPTSWLNLGRRLLCFGLGCIVCCYMAARLFPRVYFFGLFWRFLNRVARIGLVHFFSWRRALSLGAIFLSHLLRARWRRIGLFLIRAFAVAIGAFGIRFVLTLLFKKTLFLSSFTCSNQLFVFLLSSVATCPFFVPHVVCTKPAIRQRTNNFTWDDAPFLALITLNPTCGAGLFLFRVLSVVFPTTFSLFLLFRNLFMCWIFIRFACFLGRAFYRACISFSGL